MIEHFTRKNHHINLKKITKSLRFQTILFVTKLVNRFGLFVLDKQLLKSC